jgi:hypothetical protein
VPIAMDVRSRLDVAAAEAAARQAKSLFGNALFAAVHIQTHTEYLSTDRLDDCVLTGVSISHPLIGEWPPVRTA